MASVEHIGSRDGASVLTALRAGLALLDRERSGEDIHRVVVITRNKPGKVAEIVAAHFPASHIHVLATKPLDERARQRLAAGVGAGVVVDSCTSVGDMVARIIEHPAPHLLVDATAGSGAARVRRFRELCFSLADGGTYLAVGGSDDEALAVELSRLMSLGEEATTTDEWFDLQRSRCITGVTSEAGAVLVHKVDRHYATLREESTTQVLTHSYGTSWGGELMVRPTETFRSTIEVSANVEQCEQRFPRELHVPPLYLRHYDDAVCAPRQLAMCGRFVLPASFHHPSVPRPQNLTHSSANKYFAAIDVDPDDAPHLPGTYFHLDSEYPGHFGHVFTEDIAKLWGWDVAKARFAELRLLLSGPEEAPGRPARFEVEALVAYGIRESDIVCIDGPVRVERLVTASQQFHNGVVIYASEQLEATWIRLREGLRSGTVPHVDRIFVARPDTLRSCVNGARVEAAFASHGFVVVRPELLPLAEQVELFASASVIAGYAGSGMVNMIHCERPGTRIVIAADSYAPSRNEFLISAVKGDDFHFFSCPARPPTEPMPDLDAMHYDFEFDFHRDGDALESLLATT